jgi:hypothetical protein
MEPEWEGNEGDSGERCTIRNVKNLEMSELLQDTILERGVPFGVIRPGLAGDLIGTEGNLDGKIEEFKKALVDGIKFVMKGGTKVYKHDVQEILGV